MRAQVVAACVVGVIIGSCSRREREIIQAVRSHLKNPDAPDALFQILSIQEGRAVVSIHTGNDPSEYLDYYVTRPSAAGDRWSVEFELHDHFRRRLAEPAFEEQFLRRLAQSMVHKFNLTVTVRPGLPKRINFNELGDQVLALIETQFSGQTEIGSATFRYQDTLRFENGDWVFEGEFGGVFKRSHE